MSTYGIASGHNAANPTALHLLAPPRFWRYEFGVLDDFIQQFETAGDGTEKAVGRPIIRWTFEALSQSEWDWLRQNRFTSQSVLLTIRTPNRLKAAQPFERWNVTGRWLDLSNGTAELLQSGFWRRATIEFTNCVSLGT